MTINVIDMKHNTYRDGFGGEVAMLTASVVLGNGYTMHVSQREDDDSGPMAWGVDGLFRSNGMPIYNNGAGERCLRVRRPNADIEAALYAAVLNM